MKKVVFCKYNMDTVCVEAFFSDRTKVSIDCIAAENELEINTIQQVELDWLIYNEPHTYVNLILSGEIEAYLQGKTEHILLD